MCFPVGSMVSCFRRVGLGWLGGIGDWVVWVGWVVRDTAHWTYRPIPLKYPLLSPSPFSHLDVSCTKPTANTASLLCALPYEKNANGVGMEGHAAAWRWSHTETESTCSGVILSSKSHESLPLHVGLHRTSGTVLRLPSDPPTRDVSTFQPL